MKTTAVTAFKLENFYLSELNTVVSLYKKHNGANGSDSKSQMITNLTPEFGLPLVVIFHKTIVVGYASAIVAPLNNVKMSYIFLPDFQNNKEIQEALELKAKRNFIQTFGDDEQSILKLKSAIDQFIYWLNL